MLSRLCISLVEGQPFMQRLLSFTAADAESEAMTMLSEGECAAAIILPEGYLQKLMNGTPCTGRIVLSEAAAVSAEAPHPGTGSAPHHGTPVRPH